jgi:hypothetical protein
MQEPAPGVFMFDFGQDISGFVRLKVEGTRGYLYKTTTFLLQQKSLFYQDRLRTTETDTTSSGKLAEYCAACNRAIIQLRHGDVLTYPKLVRKRLGTRNLHLSQGCLGKPSSFHRKELYSYTVDLFTGQPACGLWRQSDQPAYGHHLHARLGLGKPDGCVHSAWNGWGALLPRIRVPFRIHTVKDAFVGVGVMLYPDKLA